MAIPKKILKIKSMSAHQSESIAIRYLDAAGDSAEERGQINAEELVWLIGHATRLAAMRLELLQAVQSALPMSDEGEGSELKDVLTNLIIMQSRLSGRDQQLIELVNKLVDADELTMVNIDRNGMEDAVAEILQASAHVRAVAGD